ncbi:collagenase [Psychrobacillus sp. FSL W7-1493]|uniref:collagenase n=1 Tax=Psychrobacillus sp. FSL W7-1493 TaxID=2921552 RepID=UPI00260C2379|nr:collagenase [uncultured Psychrobacillus sp.]
MRKRGSTIITLFLLVAISVSIYFYFNQQKAFEYFFKFNESYVKTQVGDVTIYKSPQVLYDSQAVLEQLASTRQLAQDLFKMEFTSHDSLPIFVTLPGYKGHERMDTNTGVYLSEMGNILINGENEQFASYTTLHEYSHFLFDLYLREHEISIQELPAWFTEGIAEYFAFQVEQAFPVLYSYYFDTFPFERLQENHNENVNTIYLQGFYAIYDLIETYGEDVITKVILAYKDSGDFATAFEAVTDEEYVAYHESFRLNKNKINMLADKNLDPEKVITIGEQLLADQSSINPYSPFVLPYLVTAALEVNDVSLASTYFKSLEQLLFNPNDYLYYAVQFAEAGERSFADELIEKGRYFAEAYHYDVEIYEVEAKKIITY